MMYMMAVGAMVLIPAMMASIGFRGREQIVGIDLGTTFSVVAVKSGDQITIVPDAVTGKLLLPSVVGYHPNGTIAVGADAVAMRASHPQGAIFNAKRFIGRSFAEVAGDAATHPFRVAPNSSAQVKSAAAGFSVPTSVDGEYRWVSPIEVGSEVVKRMKESVAKHMGYPIHRAVITVPAKFGAAEAKATQTAFERAGFKVSRVLEEPTAAAVAYNLHKGSGVRYVLVYDIGGGTLDTSLLFMNGKSISVMGVAGDDHLGGSDFDVQMRDVLLRKVAGAERTETAPRPMHRCDSNGLLFLGERAKIALSSHQHTEVACLHDDGTDRRLAVSRAEFEAACDDLFRRAVAPVAKVLEDQMMTVHHVHDLVLVGGASRTPKLRELLQDLMGPDKKLHTEIDPDVTVAYGASNFMQ